MNNPKVTVTFSRQEMDDNDGASHLEDTGGNYAGCTPEEIAKYVAQDEARAKAYRNGDWHYIGIRAVATIWVERQGYRTNYTLESPGLWGIESDSDASYLESVYKEECSVLQADIEAMRNAEFKL